MTEAQILDITFEVWGAFFCIIAAATFLVPGKKIKEEIRLVNLELVNAGLLITDALAWYFRGTPGTFGRIMVVVSNFAAFAFAYGVVFCFTEYVQCFLDTNNLHNKRYRLVSHSFVFIGWALLGINLFSDFLYYFDEFNFYHRATGFIALIIPAAIALLHSLIIVIYNRENIPKIKRYGFIVSLGVGLAAFIFVTLVYGVSILYMVSTVAIIIMFYLVQTEKNKVLVQKEREYNDMRTKVLLSQIQPHFLFNSLTSIYYLCTKDPEKAQSSIDTFSKFLRANLDSLKNDELIPFEQELKHVDSYVNLSRLRFGEKVDVKYDLQSMDFCLPALTIQPLVENAIKYGASKKTDGQGIVWISSRENKDGKIIITIKDNGPGYDFSKPHEEGRTHIGLDNVRWRLDEMIGGELFLESILEQGTVAIVTVPKVDIEEKAV